MRLYLPALAVLLFVGTPAAGLVARPQARAPAVTMIVLDDRVRSWHEPLRDDELRGLRLLYDTPVPASPALAVTHWAVRSNHRLDPFDALVIATAAVAAARRHHLPYGFFCATLLQESAFDTEALSAAGAVGIAQFSLGTAADEGIDPFDWSDAIAGSARMMGRFVAAYDGLYPDPYAAALAAYNAGPGSVEAYHGVPPYPETRQYVSDIYDRWARIVLAENGPGVKAKRHGH